MNNESTLKEDGQKKILKAKIERLSLFIIPVNRKIVKDSKVTFRVLEIVGRTVEILVDEQQPSGQYETKFNAATLPKGIYFCQLKAGKNVQTRKTILPE